MKKVWTFIFTLFSILGIAQNESFDIREFYPIDNDHSRIEFSVTYMGYAQVKGRFERFKGSFRYDEKDIQKTSVSLLIKVKSIDSDNDWRDKDLKSDNWFDAKKYPYILFKSTKIKPTENGFELIGELTIKEITKEVSLKMNPSSGVLKDFRGDHQVIFTGKTTINRSEFGVAGESWSAIKEGITGVADEVEIEISILGKQIKADNYRNWIKDESKNSGKIYKEIATNGLNSGLKLFDEIRLQGPKLRAKTLNTVGQMLLKEGNVEDAIAVFKKNIDTFPKKSMVYQSYAEALAYAGNLEEALLNYRKSLEIDPNNQNVKEILRHLK